MQACTGLVSAKSIAHAPLLALVFPPVLYAGFEQWIKPVSASDNNQSQEEHNGSIRVGVADRLVRMISLENVRGF